MTQTTQSLERANSSRKSRNRRTQTVRGHVLVVDDDGLVSDSLAVFLRGEGFDTATASTMAQAMERANTVAPNIVVTDVNLPDADGFEVLRALKKRCPETFVIMITGYGTIESAVEAMKMGAFDYLTKPIIDDELLLVIERAMNQQALVREVHDLRRRLDMRFGLQSLVGHDYKMLKIFDLIDAVAKSKATVLIQGESGTGKSLLARVIHQSSDRRDKPFVEVSCGSIPESLLESELFGHARGAFTGAIDNKDGKFQAADGGTIFLDEIACASPALQVKLLRVLQEKQFDRLGSNKTITIDTRVLLATNADLEAEVRAGRFREDLFYRVNVVNLVAPPLRERLGDIPLLAQTFIAKYAEQSEKRVDGITDEAVHALQAHHWPGNVRELENVMERAVVLTRNRRIDVDDLSPKLLQPQAPVDEASVQAVYRGTTLKSALEDPEKQIIAAALHAHHWNRQATAQALDINRTTLYKKMKRYGLDATAEYGGDGA